MLVPLHSGHTEVFMVNESNRRSMTQNPDHTELGDRSFRRGDISSRHRIGAVPVRTEVFLVSEAADVF